MPIEEALLSIHTVAFCVGLSAATVVYGYFLLQLRDQLLTVDRIRFIRTVSIFVGVALIALWVSGAWMIYLKSLGDPDVLQNPKLQAKIVIVTVLSLNGIFIHLRIHPVIRECAGMKLFEVLSPQQRMLLLTGGGISFVSWYMPLVLGLVKSIDEVVPLAWLLGIYICLLVGAVGMANVVGSLLISDGRKLNDLALMQKRFY